MSGRPARKVGARSTGPARGQPPGSGRPRHADPLRPDRDLRTADRALDSDALVARLFQRLYSTHPVGTNDVGQGIFSEFLVGARVSLSIGLLAAVVSIVLGCLVGLVAGYFGGRIDAALMRLVDMVLVIPFPPDDPAGRLPGPELLEPDPGDRAADLGPAGSDHPIPGAVAQDPRLRRGRQGDRHESHPLDRPAAAVKLHTPLPPMNCQADRCSASLSGER